MTQEYLITKTFKVFSYKGDDSLTVEMKVNERVGTLRNLAAEKFGYNPHSLLWAGFNLEDKRSFMYYRMHKYKLPDITIHCQPKLIG